jgi:hypothetical protein
VSGGPCTRCGTGGIFLLHPVNEYMERTVWGFGVGSREKSFGQRLQFGQPGGKFEPLGPRTIFLGRRDRH